MKVTLKEKYEKLADEYTIAFTKKFKIQDGFWVNDKVDTAFGWHHAGDFTSYDDIRFVIDNDINTETFYEYMEYIYDNLKDMDEMFSIEKWLKLIGNIKVEELVPSFTPTEAVKLELPF